MHIDRRFWLWTAKPVQHGVDYSDVESLMQWGSWTTHEDTKRGDLALIYWSSPAKYLSYLVEATSDAYSSEWDGLPAWACDFKTHVRLTHALTLKELKEDRLLTEEFSALRGNFQQRVYEIDPAVWKRLTETLSERNPSVAHTIRRLNRTRISRETLYEAEIESALVDNLDVLRPQWKLRLVQRQFVCSGLGRIDLLCRDRKGWVVIELKRDRATPSVLGQITSYMGWISEETAEPHQSVRGLIIARGMDHRLQFALDAVQDVHFVDLDRIAGGLGLRLP